MFKFNRKMKGVGLQLDAFAWCIVALIIACLGVIAVEASKDMGTNAGVQLEMGNIQTAVVSYQAFKADGKAPSDLNVLLSSSAISASDSTDGRVHGNFLSAINRWSSGNLIDPWGEKYTITLTDNDRHGTIVSTGSGETISRSF